MSLIKYTYSVANDTLNGTARAGALSQEYSSSAIITALDHIDISEDIIDIWTKAELSSGDQTLLSGVVAAHTGDVDVNDSISVTVKNATTEDNLIRVVTEKTQTTRLTIVTHDWTDPTTWYETSIRVVDEIAQNSGDNIKYTLAHNWVIDNYHSKMSKEDYLKNALGQSLRVEVKVNDAVKTEQDPHHGADGYFLVGYEDGYIQFLSALNPEDIVKVTYNYMVNSIFTFKPPTGKKTRLMFAEAQFAADTAMNDSIVFQPRGRVDDFAPQLVNNPYPSGTLIPLENPTIYKAYSDFLNDAVKIYPESAPLGGDNWRATPIPMAVFNWDYVSSIDFRSDNGMEIQLRLQHDVQMDGWYATLTFYCTVEGI